MGKVIEGTFDFTANGIRVKRAPPETFAVLQALQWAYKSASSGLPVEQVIEIIRESSPDAAEKATVVYSNGGLPMLLLFLFMLINNLTSSTSISLKGNLNVLFDQVATRVLGGEPYPGLTGATEPEPSGSAKPDQQSGSEETSERNKPQLHQHSHQPKKPKQSVSKTEPSSSPVQTGSIPKIKNRSVVNQRRKQRRREMRGCVPRSSN